MTLSNYCVQCWTIICEAEKLAIANNLINY